MSGVHGLIALVFACIAALSAWGLCVEWRSPTDSPERYVMQRLSLLCALAVSMVMSVAFLARSLGLIE